MESSGLAGGVRLSIVRRTQPHEAGVGIAGGLGANGSLLVPVSKLAVGRNYLSIAAALNGVPFQQSTFAGTVWRQAPRLHRPHKKKR